MNLHSLKNIDSDVDRMIAEIKHIMESRTLKRFYMVSSEAEAASIRAAHAVSGHMWQPLIVVVN